MEKFKLPCRVVSLGLDMQCHHVVTTSTILSIDEAEDEVIIENGGIKILHHLKDLDDFYLDTKENRDKLEAQCRKEYMEWKESVRKQFESCSRRSV